MLLTDAEITEVMDRGDVVEGNRFLPFAYARAIEVAVLAKLREQNPVCWEFDTPSVFGGWHGNLQYIEPTDGIGYKNKRPLFDHSAPIPEDDGAKYRLVRKLLSTNMFNYYLLEGKSEETIDEWVDEVLAAARSGE